MPDAPLLSGDGRVTELVVLLLRHDSDGSQGIMLNRPCFANVGDLLGWGYVALRSYICTDGPFWATLHSPVCGHRRWGTGAASGPVFEAFAESPVYLGGMFAPNKVARQGAMMLHGQVMTSMCRARRP